MKQLLKAILPTIFVKNVWQIKEIIRDKVNVKRPPRDVFSKIYENARWEGGSGSGSMATAITEPYIKTITNYLQSVAPNRTVVDLGCGDMRVSKHFLKYCGSYVGVDVVPFLINSHNSINWGKDGVSFKCLDIIEDQLPEGDICILRQVLQHLSNQQIQKILKNIKKKYKVCIVTEHQPSDNPDIIPNKDMVQGGKIRLYQNSGVYLDKPPFSIPEDCIDLLLEVPGAGMAQDFDQGWIRTFKIEFH